MTKKVEPKTYETSTGVEITLRYVPQIFVEQLISRIPVPEVPKFFNETKQEWQENPLDPEYLQALQESINLRQRLQLDAAIRFGVTLPDDHEWFMEKEQVIETLKEMDRLAEGEMLAAFDLDNDKDVEALYVKYFVLVTTEDVVAVLSNCITTWQAVRDALSRFQNNEE